MSQIEGKDYLSEIVGSKSPASEEEQRCGHGIPVSRSHELAAQLGALNSLHGPHAEANSYTSLAPETQPGDSAEKSRVSLAMIFSRDQQGIQTEPPVTQGTPAQDT